MDAEKACELLRAGLSGVREWNRFRGNHDSIPDLSGANLSRCELTGVDLHGACLCGAWLGGSALAQANLNGADLRRADLSACRLYHADLCDADLRQANLRSADVTGADLTGANLTGANLFGVNVSTSELHVVDLDDVRCAFRRVERLPFQDDVRHALASILQKLDILDDLASDKKLEVAESIDDLAKELLTHSPNSEKVVHLLDIMNRIAPPLVAEVSERVLIETPTEPDTLEVSAATRSDAASKDGTQTPFRGHFRPSSSPAPDRPAH
jgi:uncharacterized protein YjbI with pentapeptide repeats